MGGMAEGGVRAIRNGLAALEQLARADEPLGVTELGRRIGLPPSSAHRLLATLVAAGYAVPIPDTGRYRSGPAFLRLGTPMAPPQLRDVARPVLERIAELTGETAHLAVLDGLEVVSIDHVASSPDCVAKHPLGSRMPAHATALGLALLVFRPDVVDALINAGLGRLTSATIADPEVLRQCLAKVCRRGYATNVRGWHPDTVGVAAPILASDGRSIAAVGLSGPASRLDRRSVLAALGTLSRQAGLEIGSRAARGGPSHPEYSLDERG